MSKYIDKLIKGAEEEELKELVEKGSRKLFNIEDDPREGDIVHIAEYAEEAQEFLDSWGKFQGISSGWESMDSLTLGMVKGELIIIGGTPGIGKSAFFMNLAVNLAKQDIMVCVATLELTHAQVVTRIAKAHGGEWEGLPIILQREQYINYKNLKKVVENAVEGGASVLMVDYIQMLNDSTENEHAEVSKIIRELKKMALQHDILVLAISSLNRQREDTKLTVKSLHGSSKLEYFADMILFLEEGDIAESVKVRIVKNRSRKLDWNDNERHFYFNGAKFTEVGENVLPITVDNDS